MAIAESFDLRFTRMNVQGEFRRGVGGGFEHIVREVFAEGSLPPAEIERLAERAEALCNVSNTLKRAVKLTTVVHLNGEEVVRRVSEP